MIISIITLVIVATTGQPYHWWSINLCFGLHTTGGEWSALCGDDEDSSSGEDGVHHLHSVCLLLEPVCLGAALWQHGQSAAVRSPHHFYASASARQSQLRHLQSQQQVISRRLPTTWWTHHGAVLSSTVANKLRQYGYLQPLHPRYRTYDYEGKWML